MRNNAFLAITCVACLPFVCRAILADEPEIFPAVTAGTAAAASTALSRVDLDVLQKSITTSAFKGAYGESHMNRYLTKHLGRTEAWVPLRSRIGPQGIDGLHVRYDASGRVRGLMVSEAKYGGSQLNLTQDGIQLSSRWTNARLQHLGAVYTEIGDTLRAGRMRTERLPSPTVQRLEVRLPNGKAAVFWRGNSVDTWKFAGPDEMMKQAGRQASRVGRYVVEAGAGRIRYARHVYHTQVTPHGLQVTVKDASALEAAADVRKLPVLRSLTVPLTAGEQQAVARMTASEVKQMLAKKFPGMSRSRIEQCSRDIVRSHHRVNDLLAGRQPSMAGAMLRQSLAAGVSAATVVMGVQVAADLMSGQKPDGVELATTGGLVATAGFGGSLAGQSTQYLLTSNPTLRAMTSQGSLSLGMTSTSLSRGVSQTVGGSVAGAIMAYGGYLAGQYDLQTANRMTLAGAAGAGVGVAASIGTMSLISAFGTASTGTAISSLSGAAATSASAAWLGGGSVASGGGGVALGGTLASGGTLVVAAAVAYAAMKGFQLYDEREDNVRVGLTIQELSRRYSGVATQVP